MENDARKHPRCGLWCLWGAGAHTVKPFRTCGGILKVGVLNLAWGVFKNLILRVYVKRLCPHKGWILQLQGFFRTVHNHNPFIDPKFGNLKNRKQYTLNKMTH